MNTKKVDEWFTHIDKWINAVFEKCPGLAFIRTGKNWQRWCIGFVFLLVISTLTLTAIELFIYAPQHEHFVRLLIKAPFEAKFFSLCVGAFSFIPFIIPHKE
jgi:hypothetical protein